MLEFITEHGVDARIHLRATSPKACTVLAIVAEIDTRED